MLRWQSARLGKCFWPLLGRYSLDLDFPITIRSTIGSLNFVQVHLQRCLKDLQEEYAKCSVTVSEPIGKILLLPSRTKIFPSVPFRETIVIPPDTDMVNEAIEKEDEKEEKDAVITIATPNHQCTLTLRAVPLPGKLAKLLDDQQQLLRGLGSKMPTAAQEQVSSLRKQVENLIEEVDELKGCAEKLWSLGPKRCGPNLLFNCVKDLSTGSAWGGDEGKVTSGDERAELCNAVLHGFQLATLAGPLCEEPMMGVAFLLLDWKLEANEEEGWGPLSGQIVSTMKEGCRKAFNASNPRLMVAMYSCQIQVRAEVLGKMYSVLGRRQGKIVQEEMVEGSACFSVTANVPVIESFNFCDELRKQTSGLAMPQLVFSHWEVLEVDPTWEPRTEEELLHFGEKADSENPARKYMNNVRRRKGLKVDEKLVEFGEKQRTITKNK